MFLNLSSLGFFLNEPQTAFLKLFTGCPELLVAKTKNISRSGNAFRFCFLKFKWIGGGRPSIDYRGQLLCRDILVSVGLAGPIAYLSDDLLAGRQYALIKI